MIVTAFAWAYVRFGKLPETAAVLYGLKPVIIAIVLQALVRLGRTAVKTKFLAMVGAGAFLLSVLRVNELVILFGAGALMASVVFVNERLKAGPTSSRSFIPPVSLAALLAVTQATPFSLWPLFLFFLKVGSVLFGSGYVLLAFLRGDLVERWGWLTNEQLLDAVVVGQVTPGPVFTTATFIGYVLGGQKGALVSTVGIFLPAFVFVALSGPLVPRLRRSPAAATFLDGLNVASVALMAFVTYELGRAALVDPLTIGAALLSALLLIYYQVNSAWLVLGGALLGLLLHAGTS